jgi:hypothetical protein
MYVTIGTLQKKVKNLTLTVREFNKRIVILVHDSSNLLFRYSFRLCLSIVIYFCILVTSFNLVQLLALILIL